MSTGHGTAYEGSYEQEITGRILEAVSREEETSPVEFDRPLYEAIDPEALERVLRHGGSTTTVEFLYLGYRVRVQGDGDVAVTADA